MSFEKVIEELREQHREAYSCENAYGHGSKARQRWTTRLEEVRVMLRWLKSNRALIAAAPDLLAALECAEAFAMHRNAKESTIGSRKVLSTIRSAIAKTKGE